MLFPTNAEHSSLKTSVHLYCDVTSLCKFGAFKSYLFLVLYSPRLTVQERHPPRQCDGKHGRLCTLYSPYLDLFRGVHPNNGTHRRNASLVNYDSVLLTRRHMHFWQIPSLCWTRGPKGHITCTWVQCATSLMDWPGQPFCILIGPKNTNLIEDVEILLPVKFRWIPLSSFREEVENVSANQRPGRPSQAILKIFRMRRYMTQCTFIDNSRFTTFPKSFRVLKFWHKMAYFDQIMLCAKIYITINFFYL